ncbi:MAG: hypothetical protein PHP23_15370 [Desulfobacterales bacterium]|nr:hypothetical protein [Desulfobacterales bacterium]MDD4073706.1 hypothetical protein [Desulfobacterales bacterium]MDD4393845.1 hypothetical protein [Desulfobacterales bacterium]
MITTVGIARLFTGSIAPPLPEGFSRMLNSRDAQKISEAIRHILNQEHLTPGNTIMIGD